MANAEDIAVSVTNSSGNDPLRDDNRAPRKKSKKSGSNNRPTASSNSKFSTLSRLRRRNKSEVSVVIKYIVFGCNVIFWLIGAFLIAVGVWAAIQKELSSSLSSSAFDPVIPIIVVGCVVFVVGFFGCIGALRENTYLLAAYIISLILILLLLIAAAVIVFGFKDWLKRQITNTGLKNILPKYRDDIDLENLIDWVQGDWLRCCGLIDYNDWEVNIYFNCSSPGIEACGFPYSCCQRDPTTNTVDRQCGYLGSINRTKTKADANSIVYPKGCIQSGEEWFTKYIVPIAGVIVAVAVILILSIGFALVLRSDINAQKAKWVTTRL